MKKTAINLLRSKRDFEQIEKAFLIIRRSILTYTVFFVIIVILLIYITFNQDRQLQDLISQKQSYLNSLQPYKNDEAKISYLSKKVKYVDKFLLDDARFLPYFNIIRGALKTSTGSASLTALTIDKQRKATFAIAYPNTETLLSSFDVIESADFTSNFSSLKLSEFSSGGVGKNIELSFEGVFKPINENSN